ncbi:HAAS signaling domain-containing protein [Cellulomonas soli]|uniref:HAAS signaling domain-containing protein n=1 Tax=Cellulomonas soli TaxID=931535 RepID=UPI003F838168
MSTLHTTASREPATDAQPADVHAYARAVRRHLSGLSPDQVDDLTDGLEADLADALADRADEGGSNLLTLFGPPQEYAAELRTAAGLAEEPAERRRRSRAVRTRLVAWRDRTLAPLRAQPWWPGAAGLAAELAPAWWVLRGYVLYRLAVAPFEWSVNLVPGGVGGWVLLLGALAVSVQWGRGRWRGRRGLRTLATLAQTVAVVAVVPVIGYLAGSMQQGGGFVTVYESPADGIYTDGEQATNLFVYDADGMPVPHAQVYDQSGRPVSVGAEVYESDATGRQWGLTPFEELDGTPRLNVYPRARVADGYLDSSTGTFVGDPTDAPLPFAQAPALRPLASPGTPTEPEPGTSPTPSATPADGAAAVDPAAPTDPAAPAAPGTPDGADAATAVTPAAP